MGYVRYWIAMLRYAVRGGSRAYYFWLMLLSLGVLAGGWAYKQQLDHGLSVTALSQQVSWGAYIANFTFLVGIAAAAVLLVVPSYAYKRADVKSVVLIGELMAVSAIVMCLLFVTVDIGRPDRILHMLPFFGRLQFPRSVLAWDVVVLTGYLLLNLHIPGYLLYKRYRGEAPQARYYLPLVFVSILWAVSIHTVTAFLYSGLGGRPFWNTAILAPRFLVSAFASGPALLIVVLTAVHHYRVHVVPDSVLALLRKILTFTIPLNLFLLGCEVFKEFYTDSTHLLSAQYLFQGIGAHKMLVPYIWTALVMQCVALAIAAIPRLYSNQRILLFGSVITVFGVWVEKGMGLIVPGFIPSPAGDLVEYTPSVHEALICLGIWCLGALLFTVMVRVAMAIQNGRLTSAASAARASTAAEADGADTDDAAGDER